MHLARRLLLLGLAIVPAGSQAFASAPPPSTVTLQWTAPGDDGTRGIATLYDVRISRDPITVENFDSATPINILIRPGPPGTREQVTLSSVIPNTKYFFAIKTCDESGNWSTMSNVAVYSQKAIQSEVAETAVAFSSPYPNPSRGQANFDISLPREAVVQVEAFDLQGRRVCTIAHGAYPAGPAKLVWDLRDELGRKLGAGVYLVRAQLGKTSFVRRIVVGT